MKSMKMMFVAVLVFGIGLGVTGGASARIARCQIDPQCMSDCVDAGASGSSGNCLRMCCVPV